MSKGTSVRLRHKRLITLMKRSSLWYLLGDSPPLGHNSLITCCFHRLKSCPKAGISWHLNVGSSKMGRDMVPREKISCALVIHSRILDPGPKAGKRSSNVGSPAVAARNSSLYHVVDSVRKEKERLTAANELVSLSFFSFYTRMIPKK